MILQIIRLTKISSYLRRYKKEVTRNFQVN